MLVLLARPAECREAKKARPAAVCRTGRSFANASPTAERGLVAAITGRTGSGGVDPAEDPRGLGAAQPAASSRADGATERWSPDAADLEAGRSSGFQPLPSSNFPIAALTAAENLAAIARSSRDSVGNNATKLASRWPRRPRLGLLFRSAIAGSVNSRRA